MEDFPSCTFRAVAYASPEGAGNCCLHIDLRGQPNTHPETAEWSIDGEPWAVKRVAKVEKEFKYGGYAVVDQILEPGEVEKINTAKVMKTRFQGRILVVPPAVIAELTLLQKHLESVLDDRAEASRKAAEKKGA
jgi:hypothetical protein